MRFWTFFFLLQPSWYPTWHTDWWADTLRINQLQTVVKADTWDSKWTDADRRVKFLRNCCIFSIPPHTVQNVLGSSPGDEWRDQPHTLSLPLSLFVYLSQPTHPSSSLWAKDKWLTEEWWKYAAFKFLSSSCPFKSALLCHHQRFCVLMRCLCVVAVICVCVKWVSGNLLSRLPLNLLNIPVVRFYQMYFVHFKTKQKLHYFFHYSHIVYFILQNKNKWSEHNFRDMPH